MNSKKYQKRRAEADQTQPQKRKANVADSSPRIIEATTILDVNGDCLEKVFDFLNLEDLLNVSDSSTLLRSSVIPVLCRKYKIETKEVRIDVLRFHFYNNPDTILVGKSLAAFKLLRLVGSEITYLSFEHSIRKKKLYRRLLSQIAKYCSNSLISLHVCDLPEAFNVTEPFPNLEVFMIGRSTFDILNFNRIFPNLRRLFLLKAPYIKRRWLNIKFKHLEELYISHISRWSDLTRLLTLNTNLRSLSLPLGMEIATLNIISQRQVRLEKLVTSNTWNLKYQVGQCTYF